MTESDLTNIESALNIAVPPLYRQWALRLPLPGEETEGWEEVFNDAERLIKENRELRSNGWYSGPWPPHLFCIGEHDGNHYFIDLSNLNSGVFYANHDAGPYYEPGDYADCRTASLEEFFADE
jgi:hypothetical protein